MNHVLEKMYFSSPVWAQNLAVSAIGIRLWWERFGGRSQSHVAALEHSETFDAKRMLHHQTDLLQATIAHSFTNVPYWRDLALARGLSSSDFTAPEDLAKLPLLDKKALRNNPERFRAETRSLSAPVFTLHTSGTTGTPLTIWCDPDSRRHHYAFWTRLRRWFGISPEMSRATFFGRPILSPDSARPPFWRHDRFQRNYLFSSYHLSEKNLPEYHKALRKLGPEEIIGYPSSLYALARWLLREGKTDIRPKAVFTTAETLLDYQRSAIEGAFGAPVCDQYGCTEMAMFVSQCEHGSYHTHPEHGLLEVVDTNGQPVPPGVEGEAVCTGFINRAMPLLRYRLGDRLVMSTDDCPCGRAFPVVRQVIGRTDDVLITSDGRPLGRLDPIFKPLKGLVETQIVQTKPDHISVRLVADDQFGEAELAALLNEFHKRTGHSMHISIEKVAEIPRESNGKFRSVVSQVGAYGAQDRE